MNRLAVIYVSLALS